MSSFSSTPSKIHSKRNKSIECPVCHDKRLIDIGGKGKKYRTFEINDKNRESADAIQKCHNCSCEIGIIFSN